MRKIVILKLLLGSAFIVSCASNPDITFSGKEKADLFLVPLDNPEDVGIFVGKTPMTLSYSKLKGNVVRILHASGQSSQWLVPDLKSDKINFNIKPLQQPKKEKHTPLHNSHNESNRFIFRGYKALVAGELTAVQEYAKKLAAMSPQLAAPHILMGLAALRAGKKAEAITHFKVAKELDPGDSSLSALIKLGQ